MSWRDLHRTKWVARWQTDKSTAQEEQRLAVASACPKWAVWRYTDSLRQEHACLISLIISLITRLSGCVCVIPRLPTNTTKKQLHFSPIPPFPRSLIRTSKQMDVHLPRLFWRCSVQDRSEGWTETSWSAKPRYSIMSSPTHKCLWSCRSGNLPVHHEQYGDIINNKITIG